MLSSAPTIPPGEIGSLSGELTNCRHSVLDTVGWVI